MISKVLNKALKHGTHSIRGVLGTKLFCGGALALSE